MRHYTLAVCILGFLVGCGKEGAGVTEPEERPAAGKTAAATDSTSFAQVLFVLKQDGQLVKQEPVELKYDDIMTMGLTDDDGQIAFDCTPGSGTQRKKYRPIA